MLQQNSNMCQANPTNDNMDEDDAIDAVDEKLMSLVWHKREIAGSLGYVPAARESHSSASINSNVYIFGGYEGSKRTNTLLVYDVVHGQWKVATATSGIPPSPRSMHASVAFDDVVIIHGGEGYVDNNSNSNSYNSSSHGIYEAKSDLVCPGDSFGVKNKHLSTMNRTYIGEHVSCFDDMYAFVPNNANTNSSSGKWLKLQMLLAPLPRSGHSLTVATIEGKKQMILFGGYSRDNNACSTSVHICNCGDVLKYIADKGSSSSSSGSLISKLKPISWRTVTCSGKGPSARHRHSATVVTMQSVSHLAIYGGINNNNEATNDLHFLNLSSFAWSTTAFSSDDNGNGLMQLNNAGLNQPVFGHTASAISTALSATAADTDDDTMLLIYGGSSNTSHVSAGCYSQLLCYNLYENEWFRPATGFLFPSERCGHSGAVCNWSPVNLLPTAVDTDVAPTAGIATTTISNQMKGSSLVIVGGYNSFNAINDVWILDLQWRPTGIQQYDFTAKKNLLTHSQSMPIIPVDDVTASDKNSNSSNGNTLISDTARYLAMVNDDPESRKAFHKVRKQRSQADLQVLTERDRYNQAVRNEERIMTELNTLKQQLLDERKVHEYECSELRKALEDSVKKECKLRLLNDEWARILAIHCINTHISD